MKKSLTIRCLLILGGIELLFSPANTWAVAQQLQVSSAPAAFAPLVVAAVLRMLTSGVVLAYFLRPYETYARAAEGAQNASLLRAADRAIQSTVLRFSVIHAASWFVFLGGAMAALWGMGPERVPISAGVPNALVLTLIALSLAAFSFTYPLMGTLTADAAMDCESAARLAGVALDRKQSSVQGRLALVSICVGLAPATWVMSNAYITQLQGSRDQFACQARLGASKLAALVSQRTGAFEITPAEADDVVKRAIGPDALAVIMKNNASRAIAPEQERFLAAEPEFGRWLAEEHGSKSSSDVRIWPRGDRTAAVERVGDYTVAAVISKAPGPSDWFITNSSAFAVAVIAWALVAAMIIGRSVSVPLERLTGTARRVVEHGDLTQIGEIPSARSDEVGLLTEQFNNMLSLMRSLGRVAHQIARGDLRTEVTGKGELPDAFRHMVSSLQTVVTQIREASMDLASAAAEIFAAAQEQEAAATTQSSGMIEISRTMDSLSESAAHVSDAVTGVLSNAERTLRNTDEMVRRIGELTSHANRIAEILEVIRDIADRSDLLALNGSLEASRAGEGGRGFSLVAAEMRRLAERVTASVQDVKRLVTDIRDSGSSTVIATEESRKLANGTTDAARQITFVTQQQRTGTEQVSASIKNITQVVAQAASATSQTRTSAESLKTQADRLAEIVKKFDLLVGADQAA